MLNYLQTLKTIKILEKRWEKYCILSAACTYNLTYQNCKKLFYVKRYLRTVTSTSTVIYRSAMWEKSLGFCGCLTLVLILFVSHGTIRTWDILLLLQRSLLLHFQGEVTTQWPMVQNHRLVAAPLHHPQMGSIFCDKM